MYRPIYTVTTQTKPLRYFSNTHRRKKIIIFIGRNPTENAEPEKNATKNVVNANAQFATVNSRIGQIFNQSENTNTVKTAVMHDTRTQTDMLLNKQPSLSHTIDCKSDQRREH